MDIQNYTTEHRKGQHLSAEERHEIEVRLKDGWSPYRIAKHLGRAYPPDAAGECRPQKVEGAAQEIPSRLLPDYLRESEVSGA